MPVDCSLSHVVIRTIVVLDRLGKWELWVCKFFSKQVTTLMTLICVFKSYTFYTLSAKKIKVV